MANFYKIDDAGLLISYGYSVDGQEHLQTFGGGTIIIGEVPGWRGEKTPYDGARWGISEQDWVDTRTTTLLQAASSLSVLQTRRLQYPPLEDFADAYYWATHGDTTKMDAYLAKVEAVKQANPK